jgi:chromate reductase, NAD(P)H dehydrogenase (quinone)
MVLYESLADLPAFSPDDEQAALPAAAADLRQQIAITDAVLFCTPQYAGTLPGSFKNLLDWTVGGMEIYRKPVAWINAAAIGRGHGATASLELVLGYVGFDGLIADRTIRDQLSDVWSAIMVHLEAR